MKFSEMIDSIKKTNSRKSWRFIKNFALAINIIIELLGVPVALFGIFNARISVTDGGGNTRTVLSNPFGYYRFDELPAGRNLYFQRFIKALFICSAYAGLIVQWRFGGD